ncbi:MAG TPA: adenylate/guanylate cyclase domain-containing protein [Acidimicrobiales bacterium]|nr:adenylate/guanylate cyclase domain-containing protein [Acidimicrobiales bacterium]
MRVQRSFAFIDLSGFTALTQSLGDDHAVGLLEEFRSVVRKTCSRRAVRIAKWLGDGAMLVGVEFTPLVAASLEIGNLADRVPRSTSVRCGISAGPVILLEGDDYIGHSVNVAARLCDMAGPGTVLATTEVVPYLPAWATVADRQLTDIKGLDGPIEVASLSLSTGVEGADQDPVCGIELSADTATAVRNGTAGETILFCSDSCLETWEDRRDVGAGAVSDDDPSVGAFRIPTANQGP